MTVTQAVFQGGASVTPAVSWNGATSNKAMLSTEKIVLVTGTDSASRKLTLPKTGVVAGDRYEVVWDISGASSAAYGVTIVSNSDSGIDGFDNKSVGGIVLVAKINEPNVPADWSVVNVWERATFTWTAATGGGTGANYGSARTAIIARNNKLVSLVVSTTTDTMITGTSATAYIATSGGEVPARFRAAESRIAACEVGPSTSTYEPGYVGMSSSGNLTFYRGTEAAWPSSTTIRLIGTAGFCMSYSI